jgi:hypothetical protein
MERNEKWTGRACCELARGPSCRLGCARAGERQELRGACRWSDEPELAECLEDRERADECCASVANATCRATCAELFHRPGKQAAALKLYGSKGCFHQVPKCLKIAAESKTSEDPKLCEYTSILHYLSLTLTLPSNAKALSQWLLFFFRFHH